MYQRLDAGVSSVVERNWMEFMALLPHVVVRIFTFSWNGLFDLQQSV